MVSKTLKLRLTRLFNLITPVLSGVEYDCLDEAQVTKHRIKYYVRS